MSSEPTPQAVPFEKTAAFLERLKLKGEPSEDELLDFLDAAIKDLENPANRKEVEDSIAQLGESAVRADNTFDSVNRELKNFIDEHGPQFPGISAFQTEWEGYKTTWTDYLWTSRDFATKTSASYLEYTYIYIEWLDEVNTPEDVAECAQALKEFGDEKPTNIPEDFAEQFKVLRQDIEGFMSRFTRYLEDEGSRVDALIARLLDELDVLQKELDKLENDVNIATIALAALWWSIIGAAAAGTALGVITKQRNDKRSDVRAKEREIDDANRQKAGLEKIEAAFKGLAPDIEHLCDALNAFASTWSGFHAEAVKFGDWLIKLQNPAQKPPLFVGYMKLAKGVSDSLQDGLDRYARTIHLSQARKRVKSRRT